MVRLRAVWMTNHPPSVLDTVGVCTNVVSEINYIMSNDTLKQSVQLDR